jgi:hypothetical protein
MKPKSARLAGPVAAAAAVAVAVAADTVVAVAAETAAVVETAAAVEIAAVVAAAHAAGKCLEGPSLTLSHADNVGETGSVHHISLS